MKSLLKTQLLIITTILLMAFAPELNAVAPNNRLLNSPQSFSAFQSETYNQFTGSRSTAVFEYTGSMSRLIQAYSHHSSGWPRPNSWWLG